MYEPRFSNRILCSSTMFLVPVIMGLWAQVGALTLGPFVIFLTSINHWRRPVLNSWRRRVDVAFVGLSIPVYFHLARNSVALYFYVFALICYGCAFALGSRKLADLASRAHVCMHLAAVAGTTLLFYGDSLSMVDG